MLRHEQRLQAILQLVLSRPARLAHEGAIAGIVSREHQVTLTTAYRDLEELERRDWIYRLHGRVYVTRPGVRVLNERARQEATLLEQATLEADDDVREATLK